MSRVKCSYADKYQGTVAPTCGCEVCALKHELAALREDKERLEKALKTELEFHQFALKRTGPNSDYALSYVHEDRIEKLKTALAGDKKL